MGVPRYGSFHFTQELLGEQGIIQELKKARQVRPNRHSLECPLEWRTGSYGFRLFEVFARDSWFAPPTGRSGKQKNNKFPSSIVSRPVNASTMLRRVAFVYSDRTRVTNESGNQ